MYEIGGQKIPCFLTTCSSLATTCPGLPSSVSKVDKKTPMNIGEKMNCNKFAPHSKTYIKKVTPIIKQHHDYIIMHLEKTKWNLDHLIK